MIRILTLALALAPAAALAHPGHGAPEPHVHWEVVVAGLAVAAVVAPMVLRRLRR